MQRLLTPIDYDKVVEIISTKIENRKRIQGRGKVLTGEQFNLADVGFNLVDKQYYELKRCPIDVAIPSMQYLKFRQLLLQISGMAIYNKGNKRIKTIFKYVLNLKELDQHDYMIYLPFEWFKSISPRLVDRVR